MRVSRAEGRGSLIGYVDPYYTVPTSYLFLSTRDGLQTLHIAHARQVHTHIYASVHVSTDHTTFHNTHTFMSPLVRVSSPPAIERCGPCVRAARGPSEGARSPRREKLSSHIHKRVRKRVQLSSSFGHRCSWPHHVALLAVRYGAGQGTRLSQHSALEHRARGFDHTQITRNRVERAATHSSIMPRSARLGVPGRSARVDG